MLKWYHTRMHSSRMRTVLCSGRLSCQARTPSCHAWPPLRHTCPPSPQPLLWTVINVVKRSFSLFFITSLLSPNNASKWSVSDLHRQISDELSRSNFLDFHVVLRKIWPKNQLATKLGLVLLWEILNRHFQYLSYSVWYVTCASFLVCIQDEP